MAGAQTSSGQGVGNAIGDAGCRESTSDEGGNAPTPTRDGSITPTPENRNNTIAALDSAARQVKDLWGRVIGSSRNNRIESDPDEGNGPDGASRYDTPAGMRTPLPRDTQNVASAPRHGKQRMVEPYSDEEPETGGDRGGQEDVCMEENSTNARDQRGYGGVRCISVSTI